MEDVLYVFHNMVVFAAEYCMGKCFLTMVAGMFVLPVIWFIRKGNRARRPDVNCYAMLFLFPAAFMGMNKVFFCGYMAVFPVLAHMCIRPVHGMLYFGVMGILFGRYLWKNVRLGKRVRALPVLEDCEEFEQAISLVSGRKVSHNLSARYLHRVKLYVTEEAVSPFSGGLLHPYVVVPRRMLAEWPEKELRTVLCHELIHIRSGHILWLNLFSLLKIYWWGNPLIYPWERLFREDLELVCDVRCIRYTEVSCGTYGNALLRMIALMQGAGPEGTLCFSGRNDFRIVKRRIESLAVGAGEANSHRRWRRRRVIFSGIFLCAFLLVALTSYPRYTRMQEIVLYDEEINLLDYDSEELRAAVRVQDGELLIDRERFGELLAQKEFSGEYVYLSFDTIMKLPGSGGGGNVGMVAVADCGDIFYLSAESLENDLAEFWLKYLI